MSPVPPDDRCVFVLAPASALFFLSFFRFSVVKAECRRAALVPEQAGNGMMGHIVASALAKLTFAPKGMVEGDGAEGVLARADHLLEVMNIILAAMYNVAARLVSATAACTPFVSVTGY